MMQYQIARASTALLAAVKDAANVVRDTFQETNLNEMNVQVHITGRVDGDLRVKFFVGESGYGDERVHGISFDECLSEFLRRKGWQKNNDALLLTSRGEQEVE